MTIERAKRLAEQWASGGVCTLRDGEGQEYHRLFLSMLLGKQDVVKQDVVRCVECKHWKPSGGKAGNSFSDMEYIGGCEFTNYYLRESDFCSYGEREEGAD